MSLRQQSVSLLAVSMVLIVTGGAQAADPFYENLWEQGDRALVSEDFTEAGKKLRIACFGLLEEPDRLASCLARLAVSEHHVGDVDRVRSTLDRILEINDRFDVYAGLSSSDKQFLDPLLKKYLPAQMLTAEASLAHLTVLESEPTAELSTKQRLRRLEAQVRANPNDADALFRLAELERDRGKRRKAEDILSRLLAQDPEHIPGRCLLSSLGLERRNCDRALVGLSFCPELEQSAGPATFLAQCLVDREAFSEAGALLDRQSELVVTQPALQALKQIVTTGLSSPSTDTSREPPEPTVAAEAGTTADATTKEVHVQRVTMAVSLQVRMRRLRRALERAETDRDLTGLLPGAVALADRYPDSREAQLLAAEIAYRSADWSTAAKHFARNRPFDDEHLLLFYMAICLYETGDRDAAVPVLRQALPGIARNNFVDQYVERILGSG